MKKKYGVAYVSEEALPEGQDWVFVHCGTEVCLLLRATAIGPEVLEEAWTAYRQMVRDGIERAVV